MINVNYPRLRYAIGDAILRFGIVEMASEKNIKMDKIADLVPALLDHAVNWQNNRKFKDAYSNRAFQEIRAKYTSMAHNMKALRTYVRKSYEVQDTKKLIDDILKGIDIGYLSISAKDYAKDRNIPASEVIIRGYSDSDMHFAVVTLLKSLIAGKSCEEFMAAIGAKV